MHRYQLMAICVVTIMIFLNTVPAHACTNTEGYSIFPPVEGVEQSRLAKPLTPTVTLSGIFRGKIWYTRDGQPYKSSCDGDGSVRIKIEPVQNDAGYIFRVRSGVVPYMFSVPQTPVTPLEEPYIRFVWSDGATEFQEPFEFELEVTAVDSRGRKSEPTTILVRDEGRTPSRFSGCRGCTTSPNAPPASLFLWGILGVFFVWRRPFRRLN